MIVLKQQTDIMLVLSNIVSEKRGPRALLRMVNDAHHG